MTVIHFKPALGLGLALAFSTAAQAEWVTVAKYNGAVQCESSGISLKAMKTELALAKIPAKRARCGVDGMLYPAVCGGGTGRLNLYDIPANKLDAAVALDFQALGTWPEASEVPCERGETFQGNAAEISIGGIGPAVDGKAYRKVRQLIGKAVEDNVISRFIVYGYGIEGGFSSCVQEGQFAADGAFVDFIGKLQAIVPNPRTTAYSVTAVDQCATESDEQ